eukprot:CAMPEP_0117664034 /NCGR_PEP_ID=MMETSP0804-20121206/8970_1 /TAXON_ID=1074897 /ORGANISM="Tetraselmis astigmatica, Strain CCMP880" /LENGTH=86 /DNA_ID=CAMNT_0005471171 /DNA_START=286 /DNA_END=547 /DNA_ORIENTATION=-
MKCGAGPSTTGQDTREVSSDDVDEFISVADAIEDEFPSVIVEGIETEDRTGEFEVQTEDGDRIFAVKDCVIPDPDVIVAAIKRFGV